MTDKELADAYHQDLQQEAQMAGLRSGGYRVAIRNLKAVVDNHAVLGKQDIVEIVRVALAALTKERP